MLEIADSLKKAMDKKLVTGNSIGSVYFLQPSCFRRFHRLSVDYSLDFLNVETLTVQFGIIYRSFYPIYKMWTFVRQPWTVSCIHNDPFPLIHTNAQTHKRRMLFKISTNKSRYS